MTDMQVLKPGDRVLIALNDGSTDDDAQNALNELRYRFPDVEFTVISGAREVIVQPAAINEKQPVPDDKVAKELRDALDREFGAP